MVQYLFCPTLKTCIGAMNKYLARNKAYERQAPTKEAKKLYVISEGSEKEYYYFLYFRELSSNIDIIPYVFHVCSLTCLHFWHLQSNKYFS